MRTLIIGCGYVGVPLGKRLVAEGHEVFGMRRSVDVSDDLVAAGIQPLVGDITNPDDLAALPGPFDWVVNLVSSSRGGADVYRAVYLEGTRKILASLGSHPPRKYVYTSSSSVYGQTDGSWITETSATSPATETSRILVETEDVLLNAARETGFPAAILRVAGIYGPGRGHLFLKYLKAQAALTGAASRLLNMIHVGDLVSAIVAALVGARAGEIYNVVDDEPVEQVAFFRWLSETLGLPMPPAAEDAETGKRKRAITNKRVSNRKLKEELGLEFRFPTFREGYGAEIERLRREGELPPGGASGAGERG
jgi:nucleoside-diphosphate-sugar epimerase